MFLILLRHWRTQHSLKSNPLRRTSRVSMEREMESFLRMLRLGRRELRLVGARAKRQIRTTRVKTQPVGVNSALAAVGVNASLRRLSCKRNPAAAISPIRPPSGGVGYLGWVS